MEPTANKNLKNLSLLTLFLVLPLFIYGQTRIITLSNHFSYKGNSTSKLTVDSSCQLLVHDLTKGAYLSSQNATCHSDIGLYLYKVDSKGKIHEKEIIYWGTLADSTQESILHNIKMTSGKYVKPGKNRPQTEHWYLFEYLSNGYKTECFDRNYRNEQSMLENQLNNYKFMIWSTIEKVKGFTSKLTFIDGNSNDEAIRKGLIKREESRGCEF
jgi:hypothetical protein